jgi:hypothetical protein
MPVSGEIFGKLATGGALEVRRLLRGECCNFRRELIKFRTRHVANVLLRMANATTLANSAAVNRPTTEVSATMRSSHDQSLVRDWNALISRTLDCNPASSTLSRKT